MRRTSLILTLLIVCSPAAPAESLEAVLEHLIESYGGKANLRKADRMLQEWDLVALTGNRHGTDRRSVLLPGRLKVELTYPHKRETRLLNGDDGVVVFSGSAPRVANGPQRDAMRLQLMRLYSPLALFDRINNLELASKGDLVVLTLHESGLQTDYYVDGSDWRIVSVAGELAVGGGKMTFVTEYSDFDRVNGVLIHRRENKYAGGVNTAVLQLRRIMFDVNFGDTEFVVEPESEQENVTIARK